MTSASDIDYEWDETQLLAIARCLDMQARIVPVTGVAGTGKTTITREVYHRLREAGYAVVLCAPTGKAAKRIQEATGIPAQTMHRLLEYPHPGERDAETGKALSTTDPKRDKRNPLAYHVILADEYAMVNREIHRNLIDALPPGGRICMFGDVNQLKPIEYGKLQMMESPFEAAIRKFDGVRLTTIHRTLDGSTITRNGARILDGRMPLRAPDFDMRFTTEPVRTVEQYVMEQLENGIDYGSNDAQMISPTSKSWIGTYKLSMMLQALLNPLKRTDRIRLPREKWQTDKPIAVGIGDKVIWTENAYDLRNPWERFEDDEMTRYIPTPPEKIIMNGESGRIIEISDGDVIRIDLGDRIVEVPPSLTVDSKRGYVEIDPRKTIDLAYCITTHKAQGSEWANVTYVMNKSTYYMQSRHNLYTGISRAAKHCCIITDQRSLMYAISQQYTVMERNKSEPKTPAKKKAAVK
jgi:exodeoxyribonuclease V alpha subunit